MLEKWLLWPFFHLFSDIGFILALVFLVHLLRSRRSPASTIAWLLGVMLVPYIGVPLYILLGGRKLRKMIRAKPTLSGKLTREQIEPDLLPGGISSLFGVRTGDMIEPLISGAEACRRLTEMIEGARDHIAISTFILKDDETGRGIVKLLTRKVKEGVKVYLLLDAIGATFLSRIPKLQEFKEAGGQTALFMPLIRLPFRGRANLRNHRKITLIDGTEAMIGGMNIANEYMEAGDESRHWRDISVVLRGAVLEDLYSVFLSDWKFAYGGTEPPIGYRPGQEGTVSAQEETGLQLVPSGPDVEGDPLHESIISLTFKAEKRIWIVTPYFIPDEILLESLCIAVRKGIDVRIIVPARSNHRLADLARGSALKEFEKAGGRVFRYLPGMIHGKLILIDDDLTVIGSANMDMRSLFLNYEIALFIHGRRPAESFEAWAMDLLARSEEGNPKTRIYYELLEEAARLLSPLL